MAGLWPASAQNRPGVRIRQENGRIALGLLPEMAALINNRALSEYRKIIIFYLMLSQSHYLLLRVSIRPTCNMAAPLELNYIPGRISVIIPTYNYAHFLPGALASVLRQGIPDAEIIVVDDGSADATGMAVAPYRHRIIYHYQSNAGLSAARNTGLHLSTGEFITFLDADDLLGPEVLSAQKSFLEEAPGRGLAVCRNYMFSRVDSHGRPLPFQEWRLFKEDLDVHLCHFNIAPPHAFMLRRQVLAVVGGFDQALKACEDHDFWLRCAFHGFLPHYNPRGRVFYRRHQQSMSCNMQRQSFYNAVMHRRIANLLNSTTGQYQHSRGVKILANAAGLVFTAINNFHSHSYLANSLIQLAMEQLNRCFLELPAGRRNDLLVAYFLARIMYCLKSDEAIGIGIDKNIFIDKLLFLVPELINRYILLDKERMQKEYEDIASYLSSYAPLKEGYLMDRIDT